MKFYHVFMASILSLVFLFCCILLSVSAFAVDQQIPVLDNPIMPDRHGNAVLDDSQLLDLIIPDQINGVTVTALGAYAFAGCDLISTVTVPATVREIGAGAFVDCPNLQAIIFDGRTDASDLILGSDWSGEALVIFSASPSVPSVQLQAFDQSLAEAASISFVAPADLDYAEAALLSLQKTYDALSASERTESLTALYIEVQLMLEQLIEQARAAFLAAPADPNMDMSEQEPVSIPEQTPFVPDSSSTDGDLVFFEPHAPIFLEEQTIDETSVWE